MNLKTIKKKVFRTSVAAWLFFVLFAFSLLFVFQTAEAVTGDYNKPTTGTLAASEWNNLLNDFVAKSGSRLDGNFSINTATSSGYALDISGILRASHFSGSLGAADVSTGVFGQNTGGGDFNFLGNVGIGIGTSSPNSIITIANDHWISALNNAGTGYVNLFKVNANDELEIGGALNVGQFQFAEDSGFNTFVDMPVSATPSNGTIEGYTMKVDGDNILTVYSEANGTGGVQNKRVGIGTSTPAFTLDVAGIVNASALYVAGSPYIGSQWVTNGTSVYYNTGNVGVGISNPSAKLEVSGGNIFINDATITSGTPKAAITKEYLDSALASTTAGIITQVATSSFWQGSLTGNVYNANTGNVGIGTTNPGAKLDVSGGITLSGTNQTLVLGQRNRITGSYGVLQNTQSGADWFGMMWNMYYDWSTNQYRYQNTNSQGAGGLFLENDSNLSFRYASGVSTANATTSVLTTLFTIKNTGNVGIGVTNPGNLLSISGGSDKGIKLTNSVSNYSFSLLNTISGVTNSGFSIYDNNASSARFAINNSGNIGIGTTTIGARLSISGGNAFINDAAITSGTPKAAVTKEYLDSSLSAFASTNNTWILNGSNLYASSTSWNVGIGNSSPNAKLDVNGNVNIGTFGGGGILYFGNNTGGSVNNRIQYAANEFGLYTTQTLGMNFYTNNLNRLHINNSGNVGIGTTNPAYGLDVETGSIKINNNISGAGSSGTIYLGDGSFTKTYGSAWTFAGGLSVSNAFSQTSSGSYNSFAGVTNFNGSPTSITTSGNVGVGTTTPSTKLSISGGNAFINDAAITSGTPKAAITKEYLDSSLSAFNTETNLWKLNGSNLYASSTSWNLGIGTTAPNSALTVKGNIILRNLTSDAGVDTVVGFMSGQARIYGTSEATGIANIAFRTDPTTWYKGGITFSTNNVDGTNPATPPTEKMRISANGNVGIGVTNPTHPFEVSTTNSGSWTPVAGFYAPNNTNPGYVSQIRFGASNSLGNAAEWRYVHQGNNNFYNRVDFAWNGYANPVMTYNVYGNVGIGTTNPGQLLEIYKSNSGGIGSILNLVNPTSATSSAVEIRFAPSSSYASRYASIQGINRDGQNIIDLAFITATGGTITEKMRILSNGNVGFGTTTPSTKLSISGGNTFINDAAITSGTPKAVITKEYLDSSLSAFNTETNLWKLNGSNLYASSTAWNVGVGTTNPSSPLTVSASSTGIIGRFSQLGTWTGSNYALYVDDGDYTYLSGFRIETPGGLRSLFAPGGQAIGFATAGDSAITFTQSTSVERMRIAAGGNVGIGTTNPIAKLYVANDTGEALSMIQGLVNVDYSATLRLVEQGTYLGGFIRYNGDANILNIGVHASGDTATSSDLNAISILRGNGNVGVGTTDPGARLSISGGNTFINDAAITSGTPKAAITKEYLDSSLSAFNTESNLWKLNGSNVYSSSTAWNVGIGTTGPSEKLDINGNLRLFDSGGTAGDSMTIDPRALGSGIYVKTISMGADVNGRRSSLNIINNGANTSNINHIGAFNSPSLSVWSQNMDKAIRFLANGVAEIQTYNNGDLYLNTGSGNVGVGTTTPSTKLSISGGNVFINDAAITAGTPKAAITKEYLDSSLSAFNAETNLWKLNGSNLYASSTSWNLGIGTSNPTQQLHLSVPGSVGSNGIQFTRTGGYGDASILLGYGTSEAIDIGSSVLTLSSGSAKINLQNKWYGDGSMSRIKFYTMAAHTGNVFQDAMTINEYANVGIGIANPNSRLHLYNATTNAEMDLQSVVGAGNHWGLYNNLSDNSFRVWGGSDYLTILRNGNIGIGTTDPTTPLEINSTSFTSLKLTTSGSNQVISAYTPSGYIHASMISGSIQSDFGSDGGGGYFKVKSANPFRIGTSNTTRMTVDANGLVGINTTNPGAYRLNVNGDTNITGNLNVTGTSTATNFVGPITGTVSARNVSTGAFGADTGGGDYSFSGNLGIGTTNPVEKLKIQNSSADATMRLSAGGSANYNADILLGTDTRDWRIRSANVTGAYALNFSYVGTDSPVLNILNLLKNGNIGIGTANPVAKLNVVGNSYIQGTAYSDVIYNYGASTLMGNVGIGTTDPGVYRLKVAGDVAITGTLQTQTGSDFAEEFSVAEDLGAGTVVVMADGGHKAVTASSQAYDRTVVGIVSDNPSIIAGRIDSEKKVIVAMMGVVSVKVNNSNGKIKKGDLLTTSDIAGYAMKATNFQPGTIIGKALEDLNTKTGYIKVLVNLQ